MTDVKPGSDIYHGVEGENGNANRKQTVEVSQKN